MSASLAWAKGGTAEIVGFDGDVLSLRSTTPSPPGARLVATLRLEGADVALKVKSHGSKRDGDVFVVRARLLDAPRELRAALVALAAPAALGASVRRV